MKKCPYCAEQVQDEAIFCRYCHRDLPASLVPAEQVTRGSPPGQQPGSAARSPTEEPRIGAGRILIVLLGLLGLMWIGGLGLVALTGPTFTLEEAETLAGVLQLIVRVLIGTWAVRDRSYGRSLSGWKKVGIFILAFIPIGSWFALWYASRTLVRARFFGAFVAVDVAVAGIGVVVIGPLLASSISQASATPTYNPPVQPAVVYVAPTGWVETATQPPVAFQSGWSTPTTAYLPECVSPGQVTALDKGRTIMVCGKVIDQGNIDCPSCEYGKYSYLRLSGGFDIISYDWFFKPGWIGLCIKASDTVELLSGRPVFVFKAGEGYAGSKCTIEADGTESCQFGDYFQTYVGCN